MRSASTVISPMGCSVRRSCRPGYCSATTSTCGLSAFETGRKKGADPPAWGRHISRAVAFRAGLYRRHHALSSTVSWNMSLLVKNRLRVYLARSYRRVPNAGSGPGYYGVQLRKSAVERDVRKGSRIRMSVVLRRLPEGGYRRFECSPETSLRAIHEIER